MTSSLEREKKVRYDRQVRLWGEEAQRRLQASNFLMVGVDGVASEVMKNLILGGVATVLVWDPLPVDEEDLWVNHLVRRTDIPSVDAPGSRSRGSLCAERAQDLNPFVVVRSVDDTVPVDSAVDAALGLGRLATGNQSFQLGTVVGCGLPTDVRAALATQCAARGVDFVSTMTHSLLSLAQFLFNQAATAHALKQAAAAVPLGREPPALVHIVQTLSAAMPSSRVIPFTSTTELAAKLRALSRELAGHNGVVYADDLWLEVADHVWNTPESTTLASAMGGLLGQQLIGLASGKALPCEWMACDVRPGNFECRVSRPTAQPQPAQKQ